MRTIDTTVYEYLKSQDVIRFTENEILNLPDVTIHNNQEILLQLETEGLIEICKKYIIWTFKLVK